MPFCAETAQPGRLYRLSAPVPFLTPEQRSHDRKVCERLSLALAAYAEGLPGEGLQGIPPLHRGGSAAAVGEEVAR